MTDQQQAAEKTRTGVAYIILRHDEAATKASDDKRNIYAVVGSVKAASREAAIRAHLKATGETAGTYVATTAKGFAPVTVKVETTTTVRLGT